jgi:hypothetical protein
MLRQLPNGNHAPIADMQELGLLNVAIERRADGAVLATCDQLPSFSVELQRHEDPDRALPERLLRHLREVYDLEPVLKPRTDVMHYHLFV